MQDKEHDRYYRTSLPNQNRRRFMGFAIQGLAIASLLLTVGCDPLFFINDVTVPAPLREDFPYEQEGIPQGIFGGDHFQYRADGRVHYAVMAGLDAPNAGTVHFSAALSELIGLINQRKVRIRVVGRDSHEREIVYVYIGSARQPNSRDKNFNADRQEQIDVGLEMIRKGFARHDGSENECSDAYRAAEAEAKANRKGIWKDAIIE